MASKMQTLCIKLLDPVNDPLRLWFVNQYKEYGAEFAKMVPLSIFYSALPFCLPSKTLVELLNLLISLKVQITASNYLLFNIFYNNLDTKDSFQHLSSKLLSNSNGRR